jgi:hypothetical protein
MNHLLNNQQRGHAMMEAEDAHAVVRLRMNLWINIDNITGLSWGNWAKYLA